jgi:hypothetical protein
VQSRPALGGYHRAIELHDAAAAEDRFGLHPPVLGLQMRPDGELVRLGGAEFHMSALTGDRRPDPAGRHQGADAEPRAGSEHHLCARRGFGAVAKLREVLGDKRR